MHYAIEHLNNHGKKQELTIRGLNMMSNFLLKLFIIVTYCDPFIINHLTSSMFLNSANISLKDRLGALHKALSATRERPKKVCSSYISQMK